MPESAADRLPAARRPARHATRRALRGLGLIGLLLLIGLGAMAAVLALRAAPLVGERLTIQRSLQRIASQGLESEAAIRAAFDKQKQIDAAIVSLDGRDLEIRREDGRFLIDYAYEKELPLVEPVSLLIRFHGSVAP